MQASKNTKIINLHLTEEDASSIFCILSELMLDEHELREICAEFAYNYEEIVALLHQLQNELESEFCWMQQ